MARGSEIYFSNCTLFLVKAPHNFSAALRTGGVLRDPVFKHCKAVPTDEDSPAGWAMGIASTLEGDISTVDVFEPSLKPTSLCS